MLTFHVRASDCGGTWYPTRRGLACGGSWIEPFAHPALETILATAGDRLLCFVREKSARTTGPERAFGVPVDALTAVDGATFERLARDLRRWPLQWHSLLVTGAAREPAASAPREPGALVALESGHWGTAPVFFVADPGVLRGDWDAARLLPRLSAASLNPARAARYLAEYANPYARDTLFHRLQLLTERACARWDGDALAITYPEPWHRPRASDLRDGADPVRGLTDILDASIARWLDLSHLTIGVEVSGGLDSALVASRAAARRGGLRSYGVALIDGPTRQQDARRAEIAARFELRDTATAMQAFLPLAPGSCRLSRRAPSLPWEEGYYETFDALLAGAAADGIDVLMTGFGGDELCGLRPSELRAVRASLGTRPQPASPEPALPAPFLTPRARALLDDTLELPPRAASSESSIECAALSAARYLRHNIWPVHPLCTPELVHFCARLPPAWRYQRRIERDALTRAGLSSRITHPTHTDNFVPAMVAALRGPSQPVLRTLFATPALHDMGIVDRDALVEAYDTWLAHGTDDEAVHYLAAAVTELCLQSMG